MSHPQRQDQQQPELQAVEGSFDEKDIYREECVASGSWFYWLSGLSLVNSILPLVGFNFYFVFGLGITAVFDALAPGLGPYQFLAYIPTLMVLGIFVGLGFAATRGHMWAFILGMVLYALDAATLILFQDWFSMAVHGYVLFELGKGLLASRNL